MTPVDIGPRQFKNHAEVKNCLKRLSRNSPKFYFFVNIIFNDVRIFSSEKLPSSDHSANDWPVGYWYKGEYKLWSESRKIRAQNAGPQYDR